MPPPVPFFPTEGVISNNQLMMFHRLTYKVIEWYLPDFPATNKCHMKQLWQYVWPTQATQWQQSDTIHLATVEMVHHIFCLLFPWNHKDGTIVTNFTGKLPVSLLDGHQFLFVIHDWTANATLVKPIHNTNDEMVIKAFTTFIWPMEAKDFKPGST